MPSSPHTRFARFAWAILAYNLLVVMWGAFVRATGSGAGCGSHWPLCNGEVVPRAESVETMIEFSHRLTSGLDGFLVLGMTIWAWRAFPRPHRVRKAAFVALVFLIFEALIGAGLVRFELVADNASLTRAWVMGAHLVNTFFLLAALALTAHWSSGNPGLAWSHNRRTAVVAGGGVLALLIVGLSGAVAALGDTLFPAESFAAGLAMDLSPTAHILVRLRVFHPFIAIGGAAIVGFGAFALARWRPSPAVHKMSRIFFGLYVAQLVLGVINLGLAAPVWMQLVHLLVADLVWIAWVLLGAEALAKHRP